MCRRLRKRPATLRHARSMRRQLTPSQGKLWRRLRDRRAEFKFRRQHPIGRYILDFFCPEARLAIEVDGDQHAQPEQLQHDRRRTAWLRLHGIFVMRVPVAEIERSVDDVMHVIWGTCQRRRPRCKLDAFWERPSTLTPASLTGPRPHLGRAVSWRNPPSPPSLSPPGRGRALALCSSHLSPWGEGRVRG